MRPGKDPVIARVDAHRSIVKAKRQRHGVRAAMFANGLYPSFRAEIDEPMQIPESRVWVDLKKRVERTLPRRRWITFTVELNAEFMLKVDPGAIFLLRFIFDNR